jgi:hypothetical protein
LYQTFLIGILPKLRAFSGWVALAEVASGPPGQFPQNNNPQHPRSINLSTAGRELALDPYCWLKGRDYEKQICRSVGFGVSKHLLPGFPS